MDLCRAGCGSEVLGDTHGCSSQHPQAPTLCPEPLQKHSTSTVVFPPSEETKSQTFSTLISLSCVLLLIPPPGLWGSDRRALQRIKGLLCSAVRGCRTRAGWCNQILPVPRVLPWPVHQPLWLPVRGWKRSHSHELDLPEPPRSQPGLPSVPLALSDTRGGDPKAKPVSTQRFCSGAVGALLAAVGWEGLLRGPASIRTLHRLAAQTRVTAGSPQAMAACPPQPTQTLSCSPAGVSS